MKYAGMPFGMWMLFAGSFQKQLTAVLGYDPQHLAFGGTGVHKQVYDLLDCILIVRAEPEWNIF